jgi:hypothetical protein
MWQQLADTRDPVMMHVLQDCRRICIAETAGELE